MNTIESALSLYRYTHVNGHSLDLLKTRLGKSFPAAERRFKTGRGIPSFKPKGLDPNGPTARLAAYGTSPRRGREATRMMVRLRDKFTCRDCGAVRTPTEVLKHNSRMTSLQGRMKLFDVHHLNGQCGKLSRSYDRAGDIDGLITLCHRCHFNRPEHRVQSPEFKSRRQPV